MHIKSWMGGIITLAVIGGIAGTGFSHYYQAQAIDGEELAQTSGGSGGSAGTGASGGSGGAGTGTGTTGTMGGTGAGGTMDTGTTGTPEGGVMNPSGTTDTTGTDMTTPGGATTTQDQTVPGERPAAYQGDVQQQPGTMTSPQYGGGGTVNQGVGGTEAYGTVRGYW